MKLCPKSPISVLYLVSYTLFFVFLVFISRLSYGQWAATYGGGSDDWAYSIQQTRDGGYIVAGETKSFGAGLEDVWVLKLNPDGGIAWQKSFGGVSTDRASTIQQTIDGGYIVAGGTASYGAGNFDIWILKLSPDGNVMVQNTYGGDNYEDVRSIQLTSDGGYIVAGGTQSGEGDFWILKLNPDGSIAWQKTYGSPDVAEALRSIQQTSDGGYIVSGSTGDYSSGESDLWVLKLNPDGSVQWQKSYGVIGEEALSGDDALAIQQTRDGGYIVAGETGCGKSFGVEKVDAFVLKLNSDGSVAWLKRYGGAKRDSILSIQQTKDNGYIAAGSTASFGAGAEDLWVLKLNPDGSVAWQKTYGGEGQEGAYAIQQTTDGGYIVAGRTKSFGAAGFDFWVLKLKPDGTIARSCNFIRDTNVSGIKSNTVVQDTSTNMGDTNITPQGSSATVQVTKVSPNFICGEKMSPLKQFLKRYWHGAKSLPKQTYETLDDFMNMIFG